MMLPIHLALVSQVDSKVLGQSEIAEVSAAVQKQLTRDFGPIWGVPATIDTFPTLDDVPVDYAPIVVGEDFTFPGFGIHRDQDGQPFALVKFATGWSQTVSHEAMETAADPGGNRLIAGPRPEQWYPASDPAGDGNPCDAGNVDEQPRVQFLVEICDPCEHAEFGYTVNGVLVSDFYTPSYCDPREAPGVRYSFTGSITQPRQVLRGGYLSWRDPVTKCWYQLRRFDDGVPQCETIGELDSSRGSLRQLIDSKTPHPQQDCGLSAEDKLPPGAQEALEMARKASKSQADALKRQLEPAAPAPTTIV
jgi:hypothetical protein